MGLLVISPPATVYTVTVGTGVKDSAGNAMASSSVGILLRLLHQTRTV